jgi:TPR repeat protein
MEVTALVNRNPKMIRYLLGLALILAASTVRAETTMADLFATAASNDRAGNAVLARRQYQALADRGFAPAEAKMGTFFLAGRTVDPDPSVAAVWFYKSARNGYPPAQFAYARMRWLGQGISRDATDAFFWACLAADRGRPEIRSRAKALKLEILAHLDRDELAAARERLARWRPDRAILR